VNVDGESPASMFLFSVIVLAWTVLASIMVTNSVIYDAQITEQQVTTLSILGGPGLLIINNLLKERQDRVGVMLQMLPADQQHRHDMECRHSEEE